MKAVLFRNILILLCLGCGVGHANECRLKGGDLVSADVLCDLFTSVTLDLSTTLIGTWSTECWDDYIDDVDDPDTGRLTVTGLTQITYANVSDINDGCIFGDSRNFTNFAESAPAFDRFKVIGERALIAVFHDAAVSYVTEAWYAQELTRDSILLSSDNATLRLTRIDTAPSIPTALTATTAEGTVSLTWVDASSDETSFRIERKSSVDGSWSAMTSVSANTTSYSETVSAGTYWYRIKAVNGNGSSDGSIPAKVTVE